MKAFKPPIFIDSNSFENGPKLFLAGSIEMGKAIDWQEEITKSLNDYKINIFNPRRDEWDSSWEQKIENEKFRKQVLWELKYINEADIVIFYIQGDTKSPISLMEMGLTFKDKDKKVFVACENNFWRRGNVEVACYKYNIPLFENLEDLEKELKVYLDA